MTVRATVRHAPVTEVVRPRLSIFFFAYGFLKSSGYFAIFTAIRGGSSRVSIWLPSGRPGSILKLDQPCEGERSRARNAGDGRRRKAADAFLLQVTLQITPDLPDPAECEADRHCDRDLENHHQ